MALFHIDFYSEALKRDVPLNVILPVEKSDWDWTAEKYQTLYLLNGLKKDCNEWLTYSRIYDYARRWQLAVVMPSGDNSFYVDSLLPNNDYDDFVGREIVAFTRNVLPLSSAREDTFIAGASMGGFGALRIGLHYADTFSSIGGFSPAIHFFELPKGHPAQGSVFGEDAVFGDMDTARASDKNPRVLVERILSTPGMEMPRIFLVCGLQDGLLTADRSFRDFLISRGIEVNYWEGPGQHDFDFWDPLLPTFLDWLPLKHHK